jgi:hypothetical protein
MSEAEELDQLIFSLLLSWALLAGCDGGGGTMDDTVEREVRLDVNIQARKVCWILIVFNMLRQFSQTQRTGT